MRHSPDVPARAPGAPEDPMRWRRRWDDGLTARATAAAVAGAARCGAWRAEPAAAAVPRVVAPGRSRRGLSALAALAVACGACGSPRGKRPEPGRTAAVDPQQAQRGLATYYGAAHHGRRTASGERFDKHQLTAAHRTLRFGTRVRVTNTRNGRSVEVRINDRGPFGGGKRIIDVSEAAARRLGMLEAGVVPVTVEVLR